MFGIWYNTINGQKQKQNGLQAAGKTDQKKTTEKEKRMRSIVYICGCRTYEVVEKVNDNVPIPETVQCGCKRKLRRRRDLEDFPDQIKYKGE
jgi:hypothetical protein